MHWRLGNVRLRTALGFGAVAMVGAFAGARLATFLSGAVQLVLLAVVMLAAAVAMLRGPRADADRRVHPGSPRLALLAAVALGVGALTGIVGIGGGFLVVPALVLLARVPMREAVGTSLLVIAMNAASGFAGYAGNVQVDWGFLAVFIGIAVAGALAGSLLVARVPQAALRRAFGVFLLAAGSFVLAHNRGAFSAGRAATSATRDGTPTTTAEAAPSPAR
jgi:uncharacterized membrane protein YfcA